jgi:hypothetical protein
VTVSGSRKPEGKSGKEEPASAAVGSSWVATRRAPPGHSHWVKRFNAIDNGAKRGWRMPSGVDQIKKSRRNQAKFEGCWICRVPPSPQKKSDQNSLPRHEIEPLKPTNQISLANRESKTISPQTRTHPGLKNQAPKFNSTRTETPGGILRCLLGMEARANHKRERKRSMNAAPRDY